MSIKNLEKILVVDNSDFLKKKTQVYKYGKKFIQEDIIEKGLFIERTVELEKNEQYRQVIPYVIMQNVNNNKIYIAQRTNKGGEKRLINKFLIGFGGHVRQKDFFDKELFQWADREIREELHIESKVINFKYIGLIIDNETSVSRVHLGIIIVCFINGGNIEIKEKDKLVNGKWKKKDELIKNMGNFEEWSKMTINAL